MPLTTRTECLLNIQAVVVGIRETMESVPEGFGCVVHRRLGLYSPILDEQALPQLRVHANPMPLQACSFCELVCHLQPVYSLFCFVLLERELPVAMHHDVGPSPLNCWCRAL